MQATLHHLAALALAGFSMLVAADDDVDGSFEDGSGSGEPGSGCAAQFGAIPAQFSDAPPTLYSCMRASQSKQATGSLATGNTTIKRNQPQAGPVTDQGQELVVKTSSPAAGI